VVRIEQVEQAEEQRLQEEPRYTERHQRWAQWRLRVLTREQFKDLSQDPSVRLMAVVRACAPWIGTVLLGAYLLNGMLL
jgi:hypothetical protein